MNLAVTLSPLVAFAVAVLVLVGAALTLVGSLGLLSLRQFYERVHAPTLGTTLGTGLILLASMLLSSALQSRPVLHEIAIGLFITLTTPITYMLIMRAVLQRDTRRIADQHEPEDVKQTS